MNDIRIITLSNLNLLPSIGSLQKCLLSLVLFFGLSQGINASPDRDSANYYYRKASLYSFRGVYDSSILFFEKASLLFLYDDRGSRSMESKIRIADVLNQKGEFDKAWNTINQARHKIDSGFKEDELLRTDLMEVMGNHFLLTGNLDSAHFYLYESISLRNQTLGRYDSTFSYALSKLANFQYMVGNYDSAYRLYDKALQLALTKKDTSGYERSKYYQGKGIALTMKGQYDQAETNFLTSLNIGRQVLEENDPALARLYLNLGRFFHSISKIDEALKYYLRSEKIFEYAFEKDNLNLGFIYWNLGTFYITNGDFTESINYLLQAKYILSKHLPNEHPRLKALLMDIGVAFEKKGDLAQSINYYNLSIIGNNTPSVIKSHRNIANAYKLDSNFRKAEESYIKSINAAKKYLGQNERDLALCYRHYGQFLLEYMDDPEGLRYYDLSLEILRKILRPEHEDIARAYLLYSKHYLSVSRLGLAMEYNLKALELMEADINEETLISNSVNDEIGSFLIEALDLKTKILLGQYQQTGDIHYLEQCLSDIYLSVERINALRMSYSTEESKLQLMASAKSTINTGIAAAFYLYDHTGDDFYARKVFDLSERSKSIVLLNSLRGLEAMKTSNIPGEFAVEENRLKSDLYSYSSLIHREKQKNSPDEERIQLWQSIAFNLKKQYDSLMLTLEANYPSFYRLKYDNSVISADSAMHCLDADQAMIEYARTDTNYFLTVITGNSIECFSIPHTKDSLAISIKGFINLLRENTMGNYNQEDYTTYVESAYNIYDKVLCPAEDAFMGKKLIIIPDGELGFLSFDALLRSLPRGSEPDYRTLDYLVLNTSISYSSSATILFGMEKREDQNVSQKLLAFAPTYSNQEEWSTIRSSEPGIDSLRLLPIKGVEEEVNKIMGIYKGKEFAGEMATESNFKRNAGKYNVLHLAMHTLIDNVNPLFSKMVFTSGGDDSEDGLLNTYELFSMDLGGSLGVLSACNTGSGKLERGEGIMSLARGFIYAGIPSLVMTLWEINDQSSSVIMTSFYQHLSEGLPTDIALQHAKIDYISNADKFKSHPTYWAGFVNIGESIPVIKNRGIPLYWWILITLTVVLSIFFINRQVYSRKKSD